MEKSYVNSYEFIEPNSTGNEIGPLFVLQPDGTILSANHDIQYIDEVDEGKENAEPCAMFDITSQQYYVDNTTEFITVTAEQYTAGDNNIQGYLIQPDSNSSTEQMEVDALTQASEVKQEELANNEESNAINNSFTEITLNNDQYQMLERKGWVLLECYDKIFVLNTLGLHDITNNEKLVQKFRAEIQELNDTPNIEPEENSEVKQETSDSQENSQASDLQQAEESTMSNEEISDEKVRDSTEDEDVMKSTDSNSDPTTEDDDMRTDSSDKSKDKCDTLKIKTKYIFTDIPHKIYLGKTTSGKKLFAKVISTKNKKVNPSNDDVQIIYRKKTENNSSLTESQFMNIIQSSLRGSPLVYQANMVEAESIMTQLLKVAQIREPIMGNKIILTKVLICINEEGKPINKHRPMVMTGVVKPTDDGKGKFINVPKMLHNMTELDEKYSETNMDFDTQPVLTKPLHIYHIHIAETRSADGPNQAIHITKRKLSLDILRDSKKCHPNPVYACGACASMFNSEMLLKEHQENQCFADDALTIDTDKMTKKYDSYYTIIDNGKQKWYACTQCEAKFTRQFNCQKHIKTHSLPNQNSDSDGNHSSESEKKVTRVVYKCKMCPSTYFHPSSLSKHIVKMHIHV